MNAIVSNGSPLPVQLELFGVDKSFQYQSVRSKLLSALEGSGVAYIISDIGDIDRFIEMGLESIPSIRVDGSKLFSVTRSDEVDEVVNSVFTYITESHMKSLLVPVDFSAPAENAINYALALAPHLGMGVELMHVYHPVVDPHNAVILDGEMGNTLRDRLNAECTDCNSDKQRNKESTIVTSRFEIGYPVQAITESTRREEVAITIMGTLGATNVVENILGSNSSSVAMKADKPVLLVPPEVPFKPYDHIVVAFDHELIDSKVLDKLFAFNRPFNAHIDFVHIKSTRDNEFADIRDALITRILDKGTPQFSFDIHQVGKRDSDIAKDIQSYAETHRPDLLVVVARHRKFIDRIFHTSIARKICLNPGGPILVLHRS